MGFQTDCATTGEDRRRYHGSIPPPIYQSSLFTFPTYQAYREASVHAVAGEGDEYVYSRGHNPTVDVLERKVALLEKAESARAFASGMAAIVAAVLSGAKAGDHILAVQSIYANSYRLFQGYFPKLGIDTSFVDCTNLDAVESAIRPNTRVLYLESPGNPAMHVVDLKGIVALARSHRLLTVLDNSLSSPYNQRPAEWGIDLVVHSATKYLSGHSDLVAGIVAGGRDRLAALSERELHDLGGILGPFDAWLLLRGVRTLGLRMRAHNAAALQIAEWLETRPEVERVFYAGLTSHPQHELAKTQMDGFSGLVSFVLRGGMERAVRLVNSLRLFGIGVSWGGFESLALPIDPTATHSPEICAAIGVAPGFIRLSIGLEDVEDLIDDLERGFNEVRDD